MEGEGERVVERGGGALVVVLGVAGRKGGREGKGGGVGKGVGVRWRREVVRDRAGRICARGQYRA